MTEIFDQLGIADKKTLYGVRARSQNILTRKPMGIAARFYYFPGNWNFAGILLLDY